MKKGQLNLVTEIEKRLQKGDNMIPLKENNPRRQTQVMIISFISKLLL